MRTALLSLILAAAAAAAQTCPWMNAETAAGILGQPVQLKGTCDFRSATASLRIEIGATHNCRAHATPLKGIGNEAIACSEEKHGEHLEFIAGRVRDRAFVIEVSTKDRSATPAAQLERARQAAEQVAGNLY